ncbi:MAG: hypothetical protein WCP08_17075 [Prolixibacteraceae bacterium]
MKKAYDQSYVINMRQLAESLDSGKEKEAKPFDRKVRIGCDHHMIVMSSPASIVYEPEHIR